MTNPEAEKSEEPPPPEWCQIWSARYRVHPDGTRTCACAPYLASVAGPLPQLRFCPTGGITAATAGRYLTLPNVGCVGGSWVTPADALAEGDWARVTKLAAEAAVPAAP